ncbi:pantoate--beta-alanine ligase [Alphaproteobacteria bacterium]|nr:pantoate--beta-alanine ligase [Alphaproteobacteria bacterium]
MKILENKRELDELLAKIKINGTKIGLIPTMGSIHDGHLSLVENSIKENFFSITSIFVNPTQFNDLKDFKKYPQNKKKDIEKLNTVKCDAVFFPQIEELYPEGIKRKKTILKYRDILCDKFRPGHFDGVTTVVKSLFDIVTPDIVFFGEKDFQQLKIIKELIKKNNLPIQLIDCPSVRSKNGMSLSSRYNNFNTNQEILFNQISLKINDCVNLLKKKIDINNLKNLYQYLEEDKKIKVDYLEVRDDDELLLTQKNKNARLFISFYIEDIRIIDNFKLY